MDGNTRYSTPVMFSAFSGLLFFGFFLQPSVRKNLEQRTPEEQAFVLSRCKVGNFLRILLLLFLLFLGGAKWLGISVFSSFALGVGYFLLMIVVFGALLIAFETPFSITSLAQTRDQKKQMLISFLPIWSSYQRFKTQQFQKPYRWNKEAQLRFFMIWGFLVLLGSWVPALMLSLLLCLRVGLLCVGIDILSQQQKLAIHRLFKIYPEEVFAFVVLWFQRLFSKKWDNPQLFDSSLQSYQESYHQAQTASGKVLSLFVILLFLGGVCFWIFSSALWRKLIPLIWFSIRGLILLGTRTPIPKLPFIAEYTAKQ